MTRTEAGNDRAALVRTSVVAPPRASSSRASQCGVTRSSGRLARREPLTAEPSVLRQADRAPYFNAWRSVSDTNSPALSSYCTSPQSTGKAFSIPLAAWKDHFTLSRTISRTPAISGSSAYSRCVPKVRWSMKLLTSPTKNSTSHASRAQASTLLHSPLKPGPSAPRYPHAPRLRPTKLRRRAALPHSPVRSRAPHWRRPARRGRPRGRTRLFSSSISPSSVWFASRCRAAGADVSFSSAPNSGVSSSSAFVCTGVSPATVRCLTARSKTADGRTRGSSPAACRPCPAAGPACRATA